VTTSGTDHQVPVAIFGAPLDSGNLGVSALGLSTIYGLQSRIPELRVTLFDNGRGVRRQQLDIGGRRIDVDLRGAWISRRLHRTESLWSMSAAAQVAPWANANVRFLQSVHAVIDLSGGDSFTDLYGELRVKLVTLPKLIALRLERPLFLLPQTYGPFGDPATLDTAGRIVRSAHQAWARDDDSYERLVDLAGDSYDPARYGRGVDVAFALPIRDPGEQLGALRLWLESASAVGINVSGLLWREPRSARRFGLTSDYASEMERLVQRFLSMTDERILLVPHVIGETEADPRACEELAGRFDRPDRIRVLPAGLGPDEVKYVISGLEWFVGARMHATIAALSCRVPTVAVAYSDKFRGVFAGCGVAHRVLDARGSDGGDVAEAAFRAYCQRDGDRDTLTRMLPSVEATVEAQFDAIAESISANSGGQN
jgi:colanic acid/amylovoran biosynthesis protein